MSNDLLALANLAFLALAGGSIVMWGWFLTTWWRGETLVEYRPRRQVTWGLVDVFIALLVWLMLQIFAGVAAAKFGGLSSVKLEAMTQHEQALLLAWSSAGSLLAVPAIGLALHLRSGATWNDLGLDFDKLAEDLKLGGLTFLLLALPVYGLQMLITQFVKYEHTVTDLAQQNGMFFFAIACLAAVGTAPLVEEFLFRVIFQGWLESVAARKDVAEAFIGTAAHVRPEGLPPVPPGGPIPGRYPFATPAYPPAMVLAGPNEIAFLDEPRLNPSPDIVFEDEPAPPSPVAERLAAPIAERSEPVVAELAAPRATFASVVPELSAPTPAGMSAPPVRPTTPSPDWNSPYASPQVASDPSANEPREPLSPETRGPIWPILVSSTLFTLAHWGQWAALPSLFILAVGMGYLYQQTHRLLPSLVVHFCLNGTSMLLLLCSMLAPKTSP